MLRSIQDLVNCQMDTLYWLNKIRQVLLKYPNTEEYICYKTPAFKVKKKLICRLWENGEVLMVHADDRDIWLDADSDVFFFTDHYRNYPAVLVRLDKVTDAVLEEVLTQAWFQCAPPTVLKAYEKLAGRV